MAKQKATPIAPGDKLDYTASSTITGGDPVQISDGIVGIAQTDLASGDTDGLQISGLISIEATTAIGNAGDNVWYDNNGSPYGGTASSGAATTAAASGDFWIGILAKDKGATDTHARVLLNQPNPTLPHWPGKVHTTTAADDTMVAADDSGGVIHVTADAAFDTTITLPVGVVGMDFFIQNDEADAGLGLIVDLNGNEIIEGTNLTIAATKTAINTKATSIRGDYIHLVCVVAASTWTCINKRGTWVTST